jgi:hypothetical protein
MASMVGRFRSVGFVSSLALSLVVLLHPVFVPSICVSQEATTAKADPHDLPLPDKLPAATPKDESKKDWIYGEADGRRIVL